MKSPKGSNVPLDALRRLLVHLDSIDASRPAALLLRCRTIEASLVGPCDLMVNGRLVGLSPTGMWYRSSPWRKEAALSPMVSSQWTRFALASMVSAVGLSGCTNDQPTDIPDAAVHPPPADSQDGGLVSTNEEKAAACKPDSGEPIAVCACQKCPVETYDCYFAGNAVAKACANILACAATSGCSDFAACYQACGAVITQNSIGYQAILNLQGCAQSCYEGRFDAGTTSERDGGREASTTPPQDAAPGADGSLDALNDASDDDG